MSVAMNLSDDLVEMAKPHAAAESRSVPMQIEYWARLGKAVEENPELPLQFIKDTLLAAQEAKAGLLEPYQFGS
jgi:ParD-like antitoxin of type II bacterial toxin-antitoxin system